jgi:DNA-directed RNA polymerase specialized sigma24 family protein
VYDETFAEFVRLRYGELLRTAYLLTGSVHAAEDLVQISLLKVMPRWDRIGDPMSYLRRTMVNQRTSLWRRLRRELLRADVPEEAAPDGTGDTVRRTALLAELRRCLLDAGGADPALLGGPERDADGGRPRLLGGHCEESGLARARPAADPAR